MSLAACGIAAGGCGSSSSSSSSTSRQTAAATAPPTGTTGTTGATGTPTGPTAGATPGAGSSTAPSPPGSPTPAAPTTASGRGNIPIEVPVRFVAAHGSVRPPVVTVPAHLPIGLTVVSGDGRSHVAVLLAPAARQLAVAPHGSASQRLAGLPNGRYPLLLDGRRAGELEVGGEVGP